VCDELLGLLSTPSSLSRTVRSRPVAHAQCAISWRCPRAQMPAYHGHPFCRSPNFPKSSNSSVTTIR
jgi:hypothetical protein